MRWCNKNDKYQVCALTLYITQEENAWSSFVSSANIIPQSSVKRTDQWQRCALFHLRKLTALSIIIETRSLCTVINVVGGWVCDSAFWETLKEKVRPSVPLLISHIQLEIEFNLASIQEDKQGYGLRTERFKKFSKREKLAIQVLTEKQTCKVFYIELFGSGPLLPWGKYQFSRSTYDCRSLVIWCCI